IHKNCGCLLTRLRVPGGEIAAERPRLAVYGLAARFMRDRSGAYGVMFGLVAPFFIGALALGSETGTWYSTHEAMQGAADSAAISAAVGLNAGDTNLTLQAFATAASYKFVNGAGGTVVSVNNPPLSGSFAGNTGAVEVIIKQPQTSFFSSLFLKSPVVIEGRAVAVSASAVPCVLALSQTPLVSLVTGIAAAAFANVLADQCTIADNSPGVVALTAALFSSIKAQKVKVVGGFLGLLGTVTPAPVHAAATPDPFAGTTVPDVLSLYPTCAAGSFTTTGNITGTVTLSPGRYCGGITVTGGGKVTLSPGTYYLDGLPGFVVAVGGQVTGTGVTIVLTSSNALVNLPGLSLLGTVNLTAPSSGPYAGLVVFDDRPALLGVLPGLGLAFTLSPTANLIGTIYAPHSVVTYAVNGGTAHTGQCTRLIADTLIFAAGGSSFSKCAVTLGASSAAPAILVE
ncbi:MAG: TadE/TadG family type IV pilus assembly protein, partial [Beijerinckiaceae bacterium]